jgi:hypothetical protein
MRRTVGWLVSLALGMVYTLLAVAAPPGERAPRIGFLAFGSPPVNPEYANLWHWTRLLCS